MSRFVRPEVVTLPISHGDTLTVNRRLNHGQQTAAYARMYLAGVDGAMKVNPIASGMALIIAYLLDWTLTDDAGHLVEIRDKPTEVIESALNALDQESFVEIKEAIEAHELAMATARAEEKKLQAGASASPATSPSPDAVTGATNGSSP